MKKFILSCSALFFLFCISGCQTTSSVANFLHTRPQDSTLSSRVQSALYGSGDPVLANLRAESIQGTVILTGYVKKIRQSDEAEMIARQVEGVQKVENNIIIRQ